MSARASTENTEFTSRDGVMTGSSLSEVRTTSIGAPYKCNAYLQCVISD